VRVAIKVAWALAAALLPASLSFAGQDSAGSFDAPIKKVTVDIAPSPRNYNTRGILDCYYYPHLLVKEHAQEGEKGAQLSMLRTSGPQPACQLSREPGEREIEGGGFLKGVKDNLVFVDGDDTFNGTLSFAVYDSATGKRLFEDWSYSESTPGRLFSRVRVFSTKAGYLLKYVSVAQAQCDLNRDGKACWEKVKAKLGLKSNDMPVCSGYEHIAEMAKAFGTEYFESMVAHAVEVTLSPRPSVESVAGPVKCWPAF
jgi:hypothetical protein